MAAMMKFRVGDQAEGQNFTKPHTERFNGKRCVIIEELKVGTGVDRSTGDLRTGLGYRVRWDDGTVARVRPHYLKFSPSKPRAIDRKVPWSICAWNPHKAKGSKP